MYAWMRRGSQKRDQPFDRRQWFPQIRGWIREAGCKILGVDGTVHRFPILPGHSPVRVTALESNHMVRKLLSPLALHYFVLAEKKLWLRR
jgi:hypothetical protein